MGFFVTNARIVFGVLRFAWVCHRCTDFLMYYVVASHGVFQDFRLLTFDFIMWSLCLVFGTNARIVFGVLRFACGLPQIRKFLILGFGALLGFYH